MKKKLSPNIFARFYAGLINPKEEQELISSEEIDTLMKKQWDNPKEMKSADRKPDFDALFHKIDHHTSKQKPLIKLTFLKIAAGLAILTGLTAVLYFAFNQTISPAQMQVTSAKGQVVDFTLPDGSKVWLTGESSITYEKTFVKNRLVDLQGHAYFDVINNNTPFKILTGDIDVEVTGTSFSVMNFSGSSEAEVILVEGSVNVSGTQNNLIAGMIPNEKLIFNKTSGLFIIEKVNAKELTLWKEEKLYFSNTPLPEIAIALNQRYGKSFRVENNAATYNFTFSLSGETLKETLELIITLAPVTYRIEGETIVFEKAELK
ncbi:MAG: Fe2+-dicitrate sensor membrane [Bacteroidetes bacterium]|nr:MAG: Fe2+-dicitrate sensor membrane [Bacteroidota bacterium]